MLREDIAVVRELRGLRSLLKQSRISAGLSRDHASTKARVNLETLTLIEDGPDLISLNSLKKLVDLYGLADVVSIDDFERNILQRSKEFWWLEHREDFGLRLLRLVEAEYASTKIRQINESVIPGLLQTFDYVHAMWQGFDYKSKRTYDGVQFRLRRQEILESSEHDFSYILDESVLRRNIGGHDVMLAQLRRLREVAEYPNIHIRIAPLSTRRDFLQHNFAVMENGPQKENWSLNRDLVGGFDKEGFIHGDLAEISRYDKLFLRSEKVSLSESDSMEFIDELVKNAQNEYAA